MELKPTKSIQNKYVDSILIVPDGIETYHQKNVYEIEKPILIVPDGIETVKQTYYHEGIKTILIVPDGIETTTRQSKKM